MSQRSPESILADLLLTLDDYHSSIRRQKALIEELMEAVRREERERCGRAPAR